MLPTGLGSHGNGDLSMFEDFASASAGLDDEELAFLGLQPKRKPVTVISADELLSLLKGNVLFIELRSDPDYRRVHLPELSIRVDPRHVATASTIGDISRFMIADVRDKFGRRYGVDAVVIADEAGSGSDPSPAVLTMQRLLQFDEQLKQAPLILDGGTSGFAKKYPSFCSLHELPPERFVREPLKPMPSMPPAPKPTTTSTLRTVPVASIPDKPATPPAPIPSTFLPLSPSPSASTVRRLATGGAATATAAPIARTPASFVASKQTRTSATLPVSMVPYSDSSIRAPPPMTLPPPPMPLSATLPLAGASATRNAFENNYQFFSTNLPAPPPPLTSAVSASTLPRAAAAPTVPSMSTTATMRRSEVVSAQALSSVDVAGGLCGLRNLGNTCYMSSVLQCLSATLQLTRYFTNGSYRKDINTKNALGSGGVVTEAYAELVRQLWAGQNSTLSPARFKAVVESFARQFQGCEQHDAHEFLSFLLDLMHEDLNRGTSKRTAVDPEDMPDEHVARISWGNYLMRNNSIIVTLFQGQCRSTLTCAKCGKRSVSFNPLMYLSVPVPSAAASPVPLMACIEEFLKEETLTDKDAWTCPRCKVHRKATKKLDLWQLPPHLIIHLKRFQVSGPWKDKINTPVDFPLTSLNLSRLVKGPDAAGAVYQLYAVSNHYGGLNGGHYTAFSQHSYRKSWHQYDDTLVSQVPASVIASPAAYILFYARTGTETRAHH